VAKKWTKGKKVMAPRSRGFGFYGKFSVNRP